MRRISIILLLFIIVTGCTNNNVLEEENQKNKNIEIENTEEISKYIDSNNTPIAIYDGIGNKLSKITTFNTTLNPLEDINIFQIFPSNEEQIFLNEKFGQAFYTEWQKYNINNLYKIGYNIKFTNIDGNKISFNILDPSMTYNEYDEYLLIYLYDDYKNINSSWYSHIEPEDYNENTLFTSIKLQAGGHSFKINSDIKLTVFTYDGVDDFDDNNEYRGNSSYTINILKNDLTN